MARQNLEAAFELWLTQNKDIPEPTLEYRFAPPRRWRFDFAWPDQRVAVEIEGLTHGGGRHQRVEGFLADCEKYEAALMEGWRVYRGARPMGGGRRASHLAGRGRPQLAPVAGGVGIAEAGAGMCGGWLQRNWAGALLSVARPATSSPPILHASRLQCCMATHASSRPATLTSLRRLRGEGD